MLCLAASRFGIAIELYESHYGQYQQEIINPESGLYAFGPEVVILAVHEKDLRLSEQQPESEEDIEQEVSRWTALGDRLQNVRAPASSSRTCAAS